MSKMEHILITGCNGQLGNEMRMLAAEHPRFTYHFTDVAELDITDEAAVRVYVEENEIDCVVNCAAYTAVDKAEDNAGLCDLLNRVAPGYLAAAVETRGGSMVQVSTDYVFDGTAHAPYAEDTPTCPASVYGTTKLAGEHEVMRSCSTAIVIRTAWLYSTFGNNFVKTMIRLGRERESLGVVFDQVGTPTYARDLARAIFCALEQGIIPGVYHFSNEGVTSWYDFTKAIHRIAGITACHVSPLHTDEYPAKAPRPAYSVLDKTKIKQTYGITIPHWEESLVECISRLEV
ncbi:MAG: dTDP-4-dehydrorhamnose reductase [Clostridium sp.]|nr:dTDP-4-dehydrorhamnose reductase [Clostridium sp.]